MAAGSLSIEAIQVMVAEYIIPGLNKLYEQSTPFIKRLKQGKTRETNSRGARIMNLVNPNGAIAWMDYNGGIFPAAGSSDYFDMRVYWTAIAMSSGFNYATLLLKDAKACYDFIKGQTDQDMQTLLKELEMAAWEDGTGIKAIVTAINGTAITMAAPFGATRLINNAQYNAYGPDGTLRVGTVTNFTLTSSVRSTGVATFVSVPSDLQVGDYITWPGSYGFAIHGVAYHVNAGAGEYQGQSKGLYPNQLNASQYDLQGKYVSISAIDNVITLNKYKMGTEEMKKSFAIWMPPSQTYRYNTLGYSIKRADVAAQQFNGAYSKTPKHGNNDIEEAVDCPDDKVYGLTMESLNIFELEKLGVIDPDGQTMRLIPAFTSGGAGSWKAALQIIQGWAGDIGSVDPRPNLVLTNCGYGTLPNRQAA